jgi:signal transduction histidine kinase
MARLTGNRGGIVGHRQAAAVHDHPPTQPIGSEADGRPQPYVPEAMAPIDVPLSSFRQATLQSERIRISVLILVLAFILVAVVIYALFGSVPEQLHLLPRFTALILASMAYESLILRQVGRAIERRSDLPTWAWYINTGIEALIPTATLLLLTESPVMGPYRPLGASATHGYSIFIILSILQLRPGLCFWTGLASALGFAAVIAYTFVVYPPGPENAGRVYPLPVYATTGILLLTCGTIAAWLAGQFRRHLMAALREAAIRGQYERLVREIARRERAEGQLKEQNVLLQELARSEHQAHEALKNAQSRLVLSEKLAGLGQLVAGVAHEIKNPLNFVINFAELSADQARELRQELATPREGLDPAVVENVTDLLDDLGRNTAKIREHGMRADSIVRGMLLHSRGLSGERQPVDLNAMLSQYANLAYHGLRAQSSSIDVQVEMDLDDSLAPLPVKPQELGQVFLNLLNNAFYAAQEKARSTGSGFVPRVGVRTRDLGDRVEIRIRDNGNGVPAAIRDRVFDPFFTTKPVGVGTGLGLSISHGIVVHEHQGQIRLETEEGSHAEFIITLPKDVGGGAIAADQ